MEKDKIGIEYTPNLTTKKHLIKLWLVLVSAFMVIFLGVSLYVYYLAQPPKNFTSPTLVTVETGQSVTSITQMFEENQVVKSSSLLYMIINLFFEPTNIKASSYIFESPLNTLEVAKRLTQGDFDTDLIRLTHIEGESNKKLAESADKVLVDFDIEKFLNIASSSEGKLFPETYFIPPDYSEEELFNLLRLSFDKVISEYQANIERHPLSLHEIITLASIIEREANSPESMAIVSGVLQNRLEIDMPLQADASLEYILDKPLQELTPSDLEIDSPYNTYLYRGLPPTPIGNPGRQSIAAVLFPAETDFFYYLTDDQGEFHYARTYEEHLENIELYLRD